MKRLISVFSLISIFASFCFGLVGCAPDTTCEHVYNPWETVVEADCSTGGVKRRECEKCGEIERASISPLGHTYGTEWDFDAESHWHSATCKHDAVADKGSHVYVDGVCLGCGILVVSQGLEYRGILGSGTYKVISSGICLDADLVVARFYGGYRVVAIADKAFRNAEGINSILLQKYIEKIGVYAFADNPTLTRVELYYGTMEIGEGAFANCPALETIRFHGTKEQWQAIQKGENWDVGTDGYVVVCDDGDILKG